MPQVFADADRLTLLLVALGLAIWVARGLARRRLEWRSLGLMGVPPATGAWPWWFAMLALILALAGPRWGRVAGSELPDGHDVVFLVDVSRSMGAEDAVPDRLGLARVTARSLVDQLQREPGDRSSLVAFAGRAVARCPLTANLDAVADSLNELRVGMIEPGGTDLGAGLATALGVFDAEEHAEGRSIVVFSDGEDHAEAWPGVISRLVAAGVVVHVVAVGDPVKTTPVPASPIAAPPGTASTPPAMTRRTDAPLIQLAQATGGAFIPLGIATTDLGALYRDRIQPTTRSHRPPPRFAERAERFSVCLSAALALGLTGSWPASRRFAGRAGGRGWAPRRWGRFLVVVAVAILLIIASLAATPRSSGSPAASATTRGRAAYQLGDFAAALAAFDEATAAEEANPIGPFDAGSALFALGRYPEALARYDEARAMGRGGLVVKVDYALGNSSAMLGDLAGAVRHYDRCLASTEPGPDLDTVRRDAALNRAFVLTRLDPNDQPRGGAGEPDDDSDGKKSPRPNRNRPNPRGDGKSDVDSGRNPADNAAPNTPSDGGPPGTRGPGGAGGSGASPPESGSPGGQLDAALQRIRDAKDQRPVDPPPPPSSGPPASGKDW